MEAVVVSIIILTVLCLLKFNIIIAIILSSLLAGFMAGMPIDQIMQIFVYGMRNMNNVALSYILLGTLAYGISGTGLATKFANLLERIFGNVGKWFLLVLAGIACLSQNVVPIHIALCRRSCIS